MSNSSDISKFFTEDPLIVGSSVLNTRFCKDIDIICYRNEIKADVEGNEFIVGFNHNGKMVECLLADEDASLQNLLRLYRNKFITQLEVCYVLKAGHIHIAGRSQEEWQKHMLDLNVLKKIIGKTAPMEGLVKEHRKATDKRIKQKTPTLKNTSKEAFFDDFVEKYIDHDEIHDMVAHYDEPMFRKMQKDDTVECHKDLWNTFTLEQKIACVAEECYVIAIERRLLPAGMKKDIKMVDPLIAYRWALYRVCTTLCSGWFRQFAIDNYYTILNYYNQTKIENALIELRKKLVPQSI